MILGLTRSHLGQCGVCKTPYRNVSVATRLRSLPDIRNRLWPQLALQPVCTVGLWFVYMWFGYIFWSLTRLQHTCTAVDCTVGLRVIFAVLMFAIIGLGCTPIALPINFVVT